MGDVQVSSPGQPGMGVQALHAVITVLPPMVVHCTFLLLPTKYTIMYRTLYLLVVAAIATASTAQSFAPQLNADDPKRYGEAIKTQVITPRMEKDGIPPVPLEISVMLKKPIVMGCQYYYRVTNTSDRTLKLKMYAVYDQQYEEKLKPGATVELLANTMERCGDTKEEKKERGCIDCQPNLTITEIEAK